MNDSKFKIADTINNNAPTIINQGENFQGNQYNNSENSLAEEKLDKALANLNETQKRDMEQLANEIVGFFAVRLDKLSEEQRERFESAKSSGWKGKVKLTVPLIKHLGISLETEREIKPDEVASGIRRMLYGDEMTTLNLLNS